MNTTKAEERLRQMTLWGKIAHAFEPHKTDNQCQRCGQDATWPVHYDVQEVLL